MDRLAEQCAGGNARVTVDLQRQVVVSPHGEEMAFAIEAIRRDALLEGLDEIGLTLKHDAAIAAFQAMRPRGAALGLAPGWLSPAGLRLPARPPSRLPGRLPRKLPGTLPGRLPDRLPGRPPG